MLAGKTEVVFANFLLLTHNFSKEKVINQLGWCVVGCSFKLCYLGIFLNVRGAVVYKYVVFLQQSCVSFQLVTAWGRVAVGFHSFILFFIIGREY